MFVLEKSGTIEIFVPAKAYFEISGDKALRIVPYNQDELEQLPFLSGLVGNQFKQFPRSRIFKTLETALQVQTCANK